MDGGTNKQLTKDDNPKLRDIKVKPTVAPFFGGDLLTISFCEPLDPASNYTVVFRGSKLCHCTSTKLSGTQLQAVVPEHDVSETVDIEVYSIKKNETDNIARSDFSFGDDICQEICNELTANATNPDGLRAVQTKHSHQFRVVGKEKACFDIRLTSCLKKSSLKSLVDENQENTSDPQWTLFHVCAKYRLHQLAEHLLTLDGSAYVLQCTDAKGRTALDIAVDRQFTTLIEIFSRNPCEEKVEKEIVAEEKARPVIRRHLLGTTTLTTKISQNLQIDKELMLLESLHTLATDATECSLMDSEETSPLAGSLKKLQEINAEIRRLRSISFKDFASDEYDEEDGYLSSDSATENCEPTKNKVSTEDRDLHSDFIEQPMIVEVAEVVPTFFEEVDVFECEFEEVTAKNTKAGEETAVENVDEKEALDTPRPDTDVTQKVSEGDTGELNFNQYLESVVEETEEELAEASPKRIEKRTESLSETSLPKRVGVLRRKGGQIKHDRPLSDSFENLKMVEKLGIVDTYRSDGGGYDSHSLDALPADSSETSLKREASDSSLTSEDTSRQRSDSSVKLSSAHSLVVSSLSLNDVIAPTYNVAEDFKLQKKLGLFSRMSFKKAKSMTSLIDVKDNTFTVEDDNRDITTNKLGDSTKRLAESIEGKKSQSTLSMHTVGRSLEQSRRLSSTDLPTFYSHRHRDDAEDTDEGTSSMIASATTDGKGEEKTKKRFGILPGHKSKEKKAQKEKDKKNKRERKDSAEKKIKTKTQGKSEVPKQDTTKLTTSTFLPKRGSSFRSNLKSVSNDIKANVDNHKAIFHRNVTKIEKIKGNERKSPLAHRKSNSLEEGRMDEETLDGSTTQLVRSQNLSTSRSSLESSSSIADDNDYYNSTGNIQEDEYDSDLDARDEPETWSELVDKKVQRKMQAKDIKRQDVIYELIQTEAVYVRTLYIMRKIYANSMEKLGLSLETVEKIFPHLNYLIELHDGFLTQMKKRQAESQNFCINNIDDILLNFFGGDNGELMKKVYGDFCSCHLDALALYKEHLKNDSNFSASMRACMVNKRSRRLSVPECITYVTIRITKYPLLLEAIIKATKDSKPGYEKLKTSLQLIKELLVAVDDAVECNEQKKVLDILRKSLEKRNVVEIKGNNNSKTVYKTSKLFSHKSRLKHDKKCQLRLKGKLYDCRMIVLADKVIFLQENGGKFQLLSLDNKAPVLKFESDNLMVREVATDQKAFFLVSSDKNGAQMYEILCDSYRDKKEFIPKLQSCIEKFVKEDDTSDEEEMRREEAERMDKLRELLERLQSCDDDAVKLFSYKNKMVSEMRDLIEAMDDIGQIKGSPCSELQKTDVENAREQLERCLSEVNLLSSMICTYNENLTVGSPTQQSPSNNTPFPHHQQQRSETFSEPPRMKTSTSSSSVGRVTSMKPLNRPVSTVVEESKPRRQSQLLSAFTRKGALMGSTEDLSITNSISSTNSNSSLSTITSALSQVSLFQTLKDNLHSLVAVTNKQDVEVARMRVELQQSREAQQRLSEEVQHLNSRLMQQQKEHERQLKHETDKYSKLQREFKRNNDKLYRQLDELRSVNQHLSSANPSSATGGGHHTNPTHSKNSKQNNSEEVLFF